MAEYNLLKFQSICALFILIKAFIGGSVILFGL